MTITAQTSKSGPYNGNGSTVVFSYTFKVADEAHLIVTVLASDGITETIKTLNTDYTVTGVGNSNGGTIVMGTAPASGEQLTITRSVSLDQEVDLQNRGSVNPETLEESLDKLTQIAQDQQQQLDRSLKVDLFDTADLEQLTLNVNALANIEGDISTVAGISSDVTAVAADAADIGTVSANIADVNAVAAIDTDVSTVAGISGNVTTVAGISTDVTTVAGISTDVSAVAAIDSDVTAVAADATDIGTVSSNITNVNTVAGISGNVTTVAGISSDVTAVAADAADIGTVATNIANVNTVAGISANVTTVAGISAAVTAVAADATDIGTVAGSIADVNAVADIDADVTTVAGISSDVTSLATAIGSIDALTYSDLMPIEVLHPAQFTIPRGWWDTGERLLTGASERYIISNWNVEADLLASTVDGVWYNITDIFTDTGGTAAVSAPGDVVRNMSDQSSGGRDVTGDNGLYATVPRPAIYSNKVSSTLTVDLPYLGNNCTIGYSTDQGVTILTGQTVGGPTEILIDRYLFGYVIIDEPISVEQTARLTQYLTALRAGYVAPTEYDGALLLETGDALLLENDDRLDLEGVVSWPLNTAA